VKGLIVSNGSIRDYKRLGDAIDYVNFIICADGGLEHLIKIDIVPDLVIGDLDSISPDGLKYLEDKEIPLEKFPSIKDKTDTELAMEYLIGRGFTEIVFMGVTGSRQDHSMANIFLLGTLLDRGIKGRIIDDNNIIQIVDDYLELSPSKGHYVSLIPLSEKGIKVSLKGFFYNLDMKTIGFASTFGISNEIIEDMGSIQIHSGKALVFISKD